MKEAFLGITSPSAISNIFHLETLPIPQSSPSYTKQLPPMNTRTLSVYYTHTQLNPSLNFEKMCSIITMRKNICNLFALPFLS